MQRVHGQEAAAPQMSLLKEQLLPPAVGNPLYGVIPFPAGRIVNIVSVDYYTIFEKKQRPVQIVSGCGVEGVRLGKGLIEKPGIGGKLDRVRGLSLQQLLNLISPGELIDIIFQGSQGAGDLALVSLSYGEAAVQQRLPLHL